MPTSANRLSLGTDYCITFTPPFVFEDFNKSIHLALKALYTLKLFCLNLSHLFLYFFTDIDLLIFEKFYFLRGEQIREFKNL